VGTAAAERPAPGRGRPARKSVGGDWEGASRARTREGAEHGATGVEVLLTPGSGPRVGKLLVKKELAAHVVPPVPLGWNVAQTQATIAFTIADELDAELARRGLPQRTAGLVTRTLVDPDDPHLADPFKPVGRYLPRQEAERLAAHGQIWAIDTIQRFGFKPVEGGFIYRAPKSGLFARAQQYLVTLEQRDAIVALLVSDRPQTGLGPRLVAIGVGALAPLVLPAVLLLHSCAPRLLARKPIPLFAGWMLVIARKRPT